MDLLAFFAGLLVLHFRLDRDLVAFRGDLDVLLPDPGKLGGDPVAGIVLLDVEAHLGHRCVEVPQQRSQRYATEEVVDIRDRIKAKAGAERVPARQIAHGLLLSMLAIDGRYCPSPRLGGLWPASLTSIKRLAAFADVAAEIDLDASRGLGLRIAD